MTIHHARYANDDAEDKRKMLYISNDAEAAVTKLIFN